MIRLGLRAQAKASVPPDRVLADALRSDPSYLAKLKHRLEEAIGSRFQLQKPIALGGMATLFLMQHRLHEGLFVAKVLHPDLAVRHDVVESFRREAVHAARLSDHPATVPIFDFEERQHLHFMIMPYVEGEDLDHLLNRCGPLAREEALHMTAQISSLLSHAESHEIAHCDLAPGNIRLDTFGRYRVLDFGISHAWNDRSEKPIPGGTPLYNSPEQARGETPDHRTDLYSLGLVLYEALTGEPLFLGTTLEELRQKHIDGNWKLAASIEEDIPIAKLLRQMLVTDRNHRMQSAFELSGILAALGFERPEFRASAGLLRPAANEKRRKSRLSSHS